MKKYYPNLFLNQFAFSAVAEILIRSVFKRILLFMMFYLCSVTIVSAQCNIEAPVPLVTGAFDNLTTSSSTSGLCLLGCSISNVPNLVDAGLTNFATASTSLGLGVTHNLRVTDSNDDFAAGSFAGFRIDPSGALLSAELLGNISIKTYLDGVLRETTTGNSLLNLTLLTNPGNYILGFNTNLSFDAIEISINSLASVVTSTDIYYAVIKNYCPGPSLACNTPTAINLPDFPTTIVNSHTGLSGVGVGSVSNPENAVSSSTTDYASLDLLASVLGSASLAIKDQVTNYPSGTYAGFEIENSNLLSIAALGNMTITTYLEGVQKEQFSGNNLIVNGTLLNVSGKYKVGFVSSDSFDEVQISINQTVGVSLGATRVYNAVFENFCAGPDLVCNTQTGMVAPTYPVFINGTNTGVDGTACVLCSVKNTENVIDQDASNYAEIDLTAGVLASGSISVKDQIKDYPVGSFVGFAVENPSLLSVNALDAITIRTYLNGVLQETKSGNTALVTVGTNLLIGTSPQTIGFTATMAFDEARLTIVKTASVDLGIVKVYQAIFQKLCPVTLECNKTYELTNPTFPVIINSNRTGVDGVACVSCAVNDTNNVLTASTTDFAAIRVTVGAIAPASIAVLDQLSVYPMGTFAGFTIKDRHSLIQLDLFSSLTISTYLDGVFQESKSAGNLLNLSLLTSFGSGAGMYNVGFRATKNFDEIRISVGSLASVINDIDVYGAFVNTSGTSGGTLVCATIDAVDDSFSPIIGSTGNSNVGNVLTNDTLSGNPVAINDVDLTIATPATPKSVGAPIPFIDTATGVVSVPVGTPAGEYLITYKICYKLNTSICDQATVTITVTAPEILANDDAATVNGYIGGTASVNVLTNDTLNGVQVIPSQVTLASTPSGPLTVNTDGTVTVAPNTPAGVYTVNYTICENLNSGNCDPATVTITVTAPEILANDDAATINGYTGGTLSVNVLTNDTLNGTAVIPSEVTLTSTPNGPLTVNTEGSVTVAPNTPAGTYTVDYTICENLNTSNCDTATVTVTVTAPAILANDDAATINGYTGGTLSVNVLTNDTLNGNPVSLSEVTLASTPNGPLTVNADGSITVASNTAAGTYTVDYTICQKLNPSNCDTATVTVTVTAPLILANDDAGETVGTVNGGTVFTNVLGNDTLNGLVVDSSQVDITFVSATNSGITLSGTNVLVAPGTPVGTYTLTYKICEKLNPTNCDSAVVNVTVAATTPTIFANNDTGTSVNGYVGGTAFANVLVNDTLNGAPATTSNVDISVVSSTHSGITLSGTDVVVAAGTPAGTYSLDYRICDKSNTTNCDVARVSVTVVPAVILANDDVGTSVNGRSGGIAFANVLGNDTLNSTTVTSLQVNTTFVSATNSGITLSGTDVIVLAGTPVGNYTLTYQICEKLNPDNCDQATVTVTVVPSEILANNDAMTVNGYTGGTASVNVLTNDTLNGIPVNSSEVTLTSTPNGPLTVNADGTVTVAQNTPAGDYTVTYQICENLNSNNCDSATVTVTVTAPVILANNDTASVNGNTGGTASVNILTNDTLNGNPVNLSEVALTSTTNGPLTVNTDGTVTVASNTPAGTYTVDYTLCQKLNPSNCDTATVTVTVTIPMILANDDTGETVGTVDGGTAFTNVLGNDTLNGLVVDASQVDITFVSATNSGITLSGTNVLVAPGTPVGNYTLTYKICEKLNPTNCDSAVVNVTVAATTPTIFANNDTGTSVNGYVGGTAFANVLVNDTLNGAPATTSNVDISVVSSTHSGITLSGTDVVVAAGTPVGTYSLDYRICDKSNTTNCDVARVSVTVAAPEILANNDTTTVNGYTGGTAPVNVLTNDTLNGIPVNPSEVTLTSTPNGPLTINTDGSITVASNTPVGNYTVDYTICQNTNSTNCESATVTVTVTAPEILANNDTTTANGYTGGTAPVNVLTNDTLNGTPVNPSEVTLTSTQNGPLTINTDGSITVASNTPVGNYTVDYTICQNTNSTNCESATVNVTVTAPEILANNDTTTANGYTGGTAPVNVLTNDTLNGIPVNPSEVTLTSTPNGPLAVNNDGSVTVASNTPAGNYTVDYTICEKLNPSNCESATVTVAVSFSSIAVVKTSVVGGTVKAGDSVTYTFTVTNTGNTTLNGVVINDALTNSVNLAVNPSTLAPNTVGTATVNYVIKQSDIDAGKVTNSATVTGTIPTGGTVTDTSGTTITNDTPTVNILTPNSSLAVVKTGAVDGTAKVGGLLTYTFTVTNTGNTTLSNIVVNDALTNTVNLAITPSTLAPNAVGTATVTYVIKQSDIDAGKVTNSATVTGTTPTGGTVTDTSGTTITNDTPTITTISQTPSIAIVKKGVLSDANGDGYAEIGETIDYSFTVINTGNLPLTNVTLTDALPGIVISGGPINLAVGAIDATSFKGTYRVTQQDIVKGSVTNQAIISGTTPSGAVVTDMSDDDSPLQDDPTILEIDGCTLEVFNAVSPDGDGLNDIFRIRGIECYPKNAVQIFNRWGVKVYEAEGYNNDTVVFKGVSEGRVTVNKSEGLPSGNYFYVIKYEDFSGTGNDKSGYLNITRD